MYSEVASWGFHGGERISRLVVGKYCGGQSNGWDRLTELVEMYTVNLQCKVTGHSLQGLCWPKIGLGLRLTSHIPNNCSVLASLSKVKQHNGHTLGSPTSRDLSPQSLRADFRGSFNARPRSVLVVCHQVRSAVLTEHGPCYTSVKRGPWAMIPVQNFEAQGLQVDREYEA